MGPKTQKRLGLKSRVLGSGTATTAADGKAAHTLKLSVSRLLRSGTSLKLEEVACYSRHRGLRQAGVAMRGWVTVAAVTGIAALAAVPALAHNEVTKTSPKKNAYASRSLGAVSVTFNKSVRRGTVTVKRSDGTKVSIGSGGRDPRKISRLLVELRTPLKAVGTRSRGPQRSPTGIRRRGRSDSAFAESAVAGGALVLVLAPAAAAHVQVTPAVAAPDDAVLFEACAQRARATHDRGDLEGAQGRAPLLLR